MRVRSDDGLAEQLIVVSVGADPEPDETVSAFHRHCAIAAFHARRPETPDFLEMKRWILRILLEMFVGLIRELADVLRQRPVTDPEIRRRMMFQRGVVFPAAWSRSAFSANTSSFPAATSRSNC